MRLVSGDFGKPWAGKYWDLSPGEPGLEGLVAELRTPVILMAPVPVVKR